MADVSVRPARAADAAEIGRIQVETWNFGYRDVLPAEILDGMTPDAAAMLWQDAITAAPTPRHRVLVATEGAAIVGFAAAGPPDDVEPDDPPAEETSEVAQLLVEPRWRRRGHGSRLMAALTDHARGDATSRLTMWIPEADTVLREFLAGSGWAVDGLARALDTGAGELREIRLHTVLDTVGDVTFDGIPLAALDFYEDLEADNSKAFWTAHKHVYEEQVKAPLVALAAELEKEFGTGKVFRPYRDVRFSKDKTPYKTNQGVWFGDSSVYVHVSAAGLFLAAGYWQTDSAQVDRLRRAVADDVSGAALERAIAAARKARFEVGGDQLTRVPSGYDKDHPRADLLRHKTLTAHREFGAPAWLATKRAKTEIVKSWRALSPLTSWLDTHVGRG